MQQQSLHRKHILLAEDDSGIVEVLSIILRDEKYEVTIPENYDQIHSLIRDREFDLILLDMSLWGESGINLYKKIRSNPKTLKTPVILISARSDARHIAESIGADGIIEKPFEVGELLKIVKNYLGVDI